MKLKIDEFEEGVIKGDIILDPATVFTVAEIDKGYIENNGHINSYFYMDNPETGSPICLRERVEVLVFKDKKIFLCPSDDNDERDRTYYIPGGSTEENRTHEELLRAECREEAAFEIKGLVKVGAYLTLFGKNKPKWHKEFLHPIGLEYDGYYTIQYVALFDKYIEEEVKNTKDIDQYMRDNGKFFDTRLVRNSLAYPHRVLVDAYKKIY